MSTTLGQTSEERAEQRGIELGIELGRLENARHLFCWLLEDRFGPLSKDLQCRIEQIEDLA